MALLESKLYNYQYKSAGATKRTDFSDSEFTLNNPKIEWNKLIPTENDFILWSLAFSDYHTHGNDASFYHVPEIQAHNIINGYEILRSLVVVLWFKWPEAVESCKNRCFELGYTSNTLKLALNYVQANVHQVEQAYTQYTNQINDVRAKLANAADNSIIDKSRKRINNYNELVTVDLNNVKIFDSTSGKGPYKINVETASGIKRNFAIGKKVNGSYRIVIYGATTWYTRKGIRIRNDANCVVSFNTIDEAKYFLEHLNVYSKTNISTYKYKITSNVLAEQVLTNRVKVKTDCGDAYVTADCHMYQKYQ